MLKPRNKNSAPARALDAKFKPRRVASALIERPAAVASIDRALERKVVLLLAPAGSGKTGVLYEWYTRRRAHRCIAWLSIEEEDNSPQRFFSYLAGAIQAAVENFEVHLPCPRPGGFDLPIELMTTMLLEAMARIDRELVIVLDDLHHVASPPIARAFAEVLRRSPERIRWIVACRHRGVLETGKLILEDNLSEIGALELNFDSEEIGRLGHALVGTTISAEDAARILERTGGWVAGVKLALLASDAAGREGDALERFGGSHPEVARYLAAQVLRDLPAEMREFLIVSSLVDRMNGDLCGTLVGRPDGQESIERVEKLQLFVQPLDRHGLWYRYHPLFLEFLRDLLRREYADRLSQLHGQASHWFAERQLFEEALAHSSASGDRGSYVGLLASCVKEWVREGEVDTALRWMSQLSREELLSRQDLWGHCALVLVFTRHYAKALALLTEAEARFGTSGGSTASHLKSLRLMLLAFGVRDVAAPVEIDAVTEFGDDVFFAAAVLNVQAYDHYRHCRFDLARRTAARAAVLLSGTDHTYCMSHSEAIIRGVDRAQGHLRMFFENCERVCASTRPQRGPAWANSAPGLAYARYEQNRLEEAEALCVEALSRLSTASSADQFAHAYLTLARVKSIQHRAAEAFGLLDYLQGILEAQHQHQPRLLAQVCWEKIRISLLQNDDERARLIAAEFSLPALAARNEWMEAREYDEAWERYGFTHAMLLTQSGSYAEARAILEVLRKSAMAIGYVARQIAIEAALAVCSWRAGEHEAASQALNRCFSLVNRGGAGRGVFDEVPDLASVADAAARTGRLRYLLPMKHLREFQEGIPHEGGALEALRSRVFSPVEPLTDRELAILKLAAEGLSNKEIGERSHISVSTAKWHLHNVFVKLDVSTRTSAIARARTLQLIE